MLLFPPRLGLPGILGWSEASDERVDAALGVLDLPIEQADARDQRSDMSAGRLHGSGGEAERRLLQRFAQAVGETVALDAELLRDTREFAQLHDDRVGRDGPAEERGSVRKDEARTSASRLSSLAPAMVKRSRKRSI